MNRYLFEGLMRDVAAGKDIAVTAPLLHESEHVLDELLRLYPEAWAKVSRRNGDRHLVHRNGATIRAYTLRGNGMRGISPDVLVLAGDFRQGIDASDQFDEVRKRAALLRGIEASGADLVMP